MESSQARASDAGTFPGGGLFHPFGGKVALGLLAKGPYSHNAGIRPSLWLLQRVH